VSLKPGFSLMDWIRLTKSGKDLAGTAGKILNVTTAELKKHNTRKDAWLAINGE
jgi:cytochrome-b5 reductase